MLPRITDWLQRIGGAPRGTNVASARLARDLGLPTESVSRILDRTGADLRKLSMTDPDVDVRPIIDRAVSDLSKLGIQSRPFDQATMERYLLELPDRDYMILSYFKAGKRQSEIAALMCTTVADVRDSLVKTYADLRIRMITSEDDEHSLEPAPTVSPPPAEPQTQESAPAP